MIRVDLKEEKIFKPTFSSFHYYCHHSPFTVILVYIGYLQAPISHFMQHGKISVQNSLQYGDQARKKNQLFFMSVWSMEQQGIGTQSKKVCVEDIKMTMYMSEIDSQSGPMD